MKTKTWILIFAVLFLVCLAASAALLFPGQTSTHAEILSDGTLIKTVDLRIDQSFSIESENGGYNIVTVQDGKIGVSEATCPDHYCMNRGFCSGGTEIVCLPNKLVIRFLGQQEIDAVVG